MSCWEWLCYCPAATLWLQNKGFLEKRLHSVLWQGMGAAEKRGQKGCCLNRWESESHDWTEKMTFFPRDTCCCSLSCLWVLQHHDPTATSPLSVLSSFLFAQFWVQNWCLQSKKSCFPPASAAHQYSVKHQYLLAWPEALEKDQKKPLVSRRLWRHTSCAWEGVGRWCFRVARHMILSTDLEAWLEMLVEVSAGGDTCLVFVNELSALLNSDFPNVLSALNC